MSDREGLGIERLFETPGLPRLSLPEDVERLYGGPFGLPERVVYANFVSSIDGIAAIRGVTRSSATISDGSPADRFVMALLRAVADAVVIGSGTLREHGGPWTAERAFPEGAPMFAEARRAVTTAEAPTLVVMTATGDVPEDHPALRDAIVVTTSVGARALAERRLGDVVELGDHVDPVAAFDALRTRGFERMLTEGGPRLMASMLAAGVIEELFVTISPKLIGGGPGRPPLTDGAEDLDLAAHERLLSARRAGDYLLLRYGLASAGGHRGDRSR